jgi:steroid 5-alpha reductase family enzyme
MTDSTVDGVAIGRRWAGVSRPVAFGVVTAAYVVAGAVAAAVALFAAGLHPVVVALLADLAATLVIFALSEAVANASLYDPYWSVAPPVIAVGWVAVAVPGASAVRQILVVALILAWAVRLTGHWAGTWRGLGHEDWRYVDLRVRRGRVPWWLVNLGGIQLMPTLLVFGGMLPVWPAVAAGTRGFGVLDMVATVVAGAAVALEATADAQLKRFGRDPANRGRVADRGVWRHLRHPNYLGEIGLWWGLWLFGVAAAPRWWWTVVGPLAMVVLFLTASIPLMDRRLLARRPGYADHMRRVPALVPRPRRPSGARP